ncbi:HNH endonuclease [Spirobacillus cienkowskii]|uniref:HNH endonuclease n=1 Tax=Spirobacillus cienkowskii TaxID=495820 RepID=UPI0030D57B67
MYGKENVISRSVPDLSKPNVNMAGRAINVELDDGRVVKVVFDQKGLIDLTPYMKVEVRMPAGEMFDNKYGKHFKMATEELKRQIEADPILKSKFTKQELIDIENGNRNIGAYTWHHHQDLGRMQLVESDVHEKVAHVGAKSLNPELKD